MLTTRAANNARIPSPKILTNPVAIVPKIAASIKNTANKKIIEATPKPLGKNLVGGHDYTVTRCSSAAQTGD